MTMAVLYHAAFILLSDFASPSLNLEFETHYLFQGEEEAAQMLSAEVREIY